MSRSVKLGLYVICVIGVMVLGTFTVHNYREATKTSERRAERIARAVSTDSTNVLEATNTIGITNAPGDLAAPATNSETSNATETNVALVPKEAAADDTTEVAGVSNRGFSRMVTHGLGLLLFAIGLAVLIAYDVSHFMAGKAERALFADDGAPANPEYEQAEELWKDGKYLEALNAMRDYLKKNPREQYVALRIAEIYEQNLFNPIAAALEYEEVLKKKLPPERWAWAAIHLVNIYSGKLNQPTKAIDLLHRIDSEYGMTSAAKKARERLLQIDPTFVPAAVAEATTAADEAAEANPPSNLPPGFRPKS